MSDNNKTLEKSIKSLRENLDSLSMDTFITTTIDALMNIERSEFLEKTEEKDKGNGYYERSLKSFSNNSVLVNVPRTRTGFFSPNTLELLRINKEQMDTMVLSLYKKGMTGGDIKTFLKEVFNEKVSPSQISELSKTFNQFRVAWQNSKLEKHYKVVFGDVVFITVKRGDEYAKEGVFIAYGVRQDNKRELLVLSVNPTESAREWGELLRELQVRGVEKIDLFVADGLPYLEDTIMETYPGTAFQKCVVHKMRGILNKVSPKDKKEVAGDLKKVFDNFDGGATIEKALEKVEVFLKKWQKKYPNLKKHFKEGNIEYYFTYIMFTPEVRRMIYTTNSIENLNRQVRKTTKNKLSFESPDRLLDYLFMIIKEFEEKNFMKFPVSNYKHFRKFKSGERSADTIF